MSSFENKDAWKDLYEKSKAREEEEKRKMVDNRPKTLEEMMKMRDLETSDIDYHPQRSPEDQGMGTYVEKSNDQRFAEMIENGGDPEAIIEAKGLKQVSDTGAIEAMIDEVIAANQDKVEEYRGGKDKLFGFFVGQVMKASKGQANPGMVNQMLKAKLDG